MGELVRCFSRVKTGRWARSVSTELRTFGQRSAQLPLLLRKPRLLQLWFSTAREAQVWLGIMLFLLVFVVPPSLSALSDYLYPLITSERKILGIFTRTRVFSNPLRDPRYMQLMVGLWTIGIGLVVRQFINHIPAAILIGEQRAAVLSGTAERIALADPEESARLRRSAQDLLIDAQPENGLAPIVATPPDLGVYRTKVISAGDVPVTETPHIGANQRYRLDKVIGSGGMGVVHAGYDTVLNRPVALKQLFGHLLQDTEQTERFRQEALALASLSHPHIVTVYDLLEESGHFWIVMELLTGGSLAEKIAEAATMDVRKSVEITCNVAAGLGFAHETRIVHRDVKPMNILFTADGIPKLTDFGNAKLTESIVHTREGLMLGSPAYMSPEQVTGDPLDYRTDIYSLGVTLYQMLTGKVPCEGETRAVLAQHVTQPPRAPNELNPDIPKALDAAVLIMLSKGPADRFQDADSVILALREAMP